MSWKDNAGVMHQPGPMDDRYASIAYEMHKRWDPLYHHWTGTVMYAAAREVTSRAIERVEAAAILPLGAEEDAIARGLTLCQLGQIHLICMLRPSLLSTTIHFTTQYIGNSPQAVVTVRMPLSMWETWSKGAQDFCETMCEAIRAHVTALMLSNKSSITDILYHCEKAGNNPGGSFFMTMQYRTETKPVPAPVSASDVVLVPVTPADNSVGL